MKQIICRNDDGSVLYEYYLNNKGKYNGLFIGYWGNRNVMWKNNWSNDKRYGLQTSYNSNSEIVIQKYYL